MLQVTFRLRVEGTPDTLGRERDRVDGDTGRVEDGVAHRRSDGIDHDLADGLRPERTRSFHRLHEEDLHGRGVVSPEDPIGPKARVEDSTQISCTATPPSPSLACATINADGVVTQLAYDSAGDLTSSTTPDGNGSQLAETTYSYDGDGEQTATVVPDGNLSGANVDNYTTATAYDSDGEVTSTTEAGGTGGSGPTVTPRTTYDYYDADGNLTSVKDPRGYTTTNTYNADDEETLVTDPDGNKTLTCYDGAGNVTETVPPVGVAQTRSRRLRARRATPPATACGWPRTRRPTPMTPTATRR